MDLSFVICTYNRCDLLLKSVHAILKTKKPNNFHYEIVIIDNNSKDGTSKTIKKLAIPEVRLYTELNQGLSHARNRGFKESISEWVVFIDDDGEVHQDFIERWLGLEEKHRFDLIGGKYFASFTNSQPRWWPSGLGSKLDVTPVYRQIYLPVLSGGILAIKKSVLFELRGFLVNLGMNGKKIGYGEETEFQIRAMKNGFKLAYSPELKMDHLVSIEKEKALWHVKAAYIDGKQTWLKFQREKTPYYKNSLFLTIHLFKLFMAIPKNLIRVSSKKYYWQNFIFDTFRDFAYEVGKFLGPTFKSSVQK